MMKKCLVFAITWLWVCSSNAQTEAIDRLTISAKKAKGYQQAEALLSLGNEYVTLDTVQARKYLEQGKKLAEAKGYEQLIIRGKVYQVALDLRKGRLQECLKEAIELLNAPEKLTPSDYRNLLSGIGNALGKLEAYEMAIEYRKKYMQVTSPKDLQYFFAVENIAQYYGQLGQKDSALFYFKKSAEIALKQRIPGLYITSLTNIGYTYDEIGNKSLSNRYFAKAQNYFDTVPGKNMKDSLIYALYLKTYATVCLKHGQFEKCGQLIDKACKIQETYHFQKLLANIFLEIELKLKTNKTADALKILDSISFNQLPGDPDKQRYYKYLAIARLRTGDVKGAEDALEKYTEIDEADVDRMALQRRLVDLTQVQMKQTMQNLEMSKKLALEERDNERLRRMQVYNWSAASALLVIGVIAFIFWRMKKNKRIFDLKSTLYEERRKVDELKEAQLKNELIFKDQDLTDLAIHINRKSDFLDGLQLLLLELRKKSIYDDQLVNKAILELKEEIRYDKNLMSMQDQIDKINHRFTHYMLTHYPDMTPVEIEVCALIRLNKSSKEIAAIKGIEESSIKTYRYRIRQKVGLLEKENLNNFLTNLKI